MEDDRLRLIFTCCHPALPPDARIALTLREVCGLETEEIAGAFLITAPALAQRIVRAKAKIRDAGIPYQVPSRPDLPERLDAVLHVIYLVFNEGYSASSGAALTRHDLSAEAIRVGRPGAAGRPGPGPLEPEPDRRGMRAGGTRPGLSPRRPLHPAGRHRGGARRGAATDWRQIVGLYDVLLRVEASPVVELNRAAVAMRDGPAAGLALIDGILSRGRLG